MRGIILMNTLFNKLPEVDKELICRYIDTYGGGNQSLSTERLNHYLRFWSENKQNFYKAFGEKFILKERVDVQKPKNIMVEEMDNLLWNYDSKSYKNIIIRKLIDTVDTKLNYLSTCEGIRNSDFYYDIHYKFFDAKYLVDNIYDGPKYIIPKEYTKNKKPFVIQNGCKIMRTLGKLVSLLDIDFNVYFCEKCDAYLMADDNNNNNHNHCDICNSDSIQKTTAFEIFRQAHSQILNQKLLKGNLCLSIHPLDFVTMSDNNCGWSSCMSWWEEGDYRLGTVEMMNSKYVVIAYLEAEDSMHLVDGYRWNNKRWRQLFIINEDMIIGNRQYPYDNEDLETICLNKLKDLMHSIGFGPYTSDLTIIRNHCINNINDKKVMISYDTEYMYNDLYGNRTGLIALDNINTKEYYVNFSGPAVCIDCGEIIDGSNFISHSMLICTSCGDYYYCDGCGELIPEYCERHTLNDGSVVCDDCYQDLPQCDICDNIVLSSDMTYIHIKLIDFDEQNFGYVNINRQYSIAVCSNCLHNKNYENLYGDLIEVVTGSWSTFGYYFDLNNIDDKILENFSNSEELKALKNLKTTEERKDFIKKHLI